MLVKVEKKKYIVPTSWSDVTCGTFQKLILVEDFIEKISILTGIPKETIDKMDWESVQVLQAATSFCNDFTMLDAVNVYPKEFEDFEIAKQQAHTILAVQGVIKKARDLTEDEFLLHLYCGVDILSIYIEASKEQSKNSKDIEGQERYHELKELNIYNEPITRWYGLMCFFLSKWVGFSLNTAIYQTTRHLNTKRRRVLKTSQSSPRISELLNRLWKSSNKQQTTS